MSDTAAVIAQHLGNLRPVDVANVFGTALRYRLTDPTLRTEFTNILERYGTLFQGERNEKQNTSGQDFELVAQYFNPTFAVCEIAYRSFRIRNTSQKTWASIGETPHNLSYFIHDLENPITSIEGLRSALPVPVRPNQELTIPLRIAAPGKPGRYRIEIKLVQEHVGWFDKNIFESELVVENVKPGRPGLVTPPHEGYFDFLGDLEQCGSILRKGVTKLREDAPEGDIRILEVACGNDPQVLRYYQSGTTVVACDVAFPQAQFGSLQYINAGTIDPLAYVFVSADAFNAPFQAGAFDMIVICAALHHFTDTVVALGQLKHLLRPGGFLVLLREPSKVFPEDEKYLEELSNGFNEQQFELAEYDEMFRRSGLRIVYEQVDYECSYKVILQSLPEYH